MIHDDLHMMPPTTSFALDHGSHQERMDRKYRYARYIFDLARKFFLFGRDRAIEALRLQDRLRHRAQPEAHGRPSSSAAFRGDAEDRAPQGRAGAAR